MVAGRERSKTLTFSIMKSNQPHHRQARRAAEIDRMKLSHLLAGAGFAALLSASPVFAAAPPVGAAAPTFQLQTTAGHPLRLSDLRGRVVVVNFFATWCPPCRAETPDLVAAARKYTAEGVTFLGVDDRESTTLVAVWASGKGVRYPIVLDADGAVERRYDVRAIPTTYVLDKNGVIRYRQLDQLEGSTLSSVLDAVVADRPLPESRIAQQFDAAATRGTTAVSADTGAAKFGAAIAAGKAATQRLSQLQSDTGSSSIDYFKATQESDALDVALAAAYSARAKTEEGKPADADSAQAALLQAGVASDREQFEAAYQAYADAVRLDPSTASDAYPGMYLAAYEMKRYQLAAQAAEALGTAVPNDPESWVTVTSGYMAIKDHPDSLVAARRAIDLATAAYAAKPTDSQAAYELGRVWLKMGRAELAAGNAAAARAVLRNAVAAAPGTIVEEQASEQLAALMPAPITIALSGASSVNAAAADPAKLWVIVRNPTQSARDVDLTARGLPPNWLLSFCYAKVCQPNRSTISLAAGASMRIELQVVPLRGGSGIWTMQVAAPGSSVARVRISGKSVNTTATVSASAL